MRKAAKVLMIYLLALGVFTIILSFFNFNSFYFTYAGQPVEYKPIMIPTIIGGIIALKLTVSPGSLKIFLVVYFSLWALRFLVMYAAQEIGEVHVFNRAYRFDLIIAGYYRTVSRLETPLPFVIYWFVNHLFTKKLSQPVKENQDGL